ncbi:MAG: DUF4252 domain-containing protein [Acidobacteriaceae bacterium]|nr:DUF4252 domain-containing protein [Acidobacteriaceae bacterium]MBV9779804.1 DUF4252 domain-containing protein [Acidobacteriaceae bacterium]
MTWKLSMLAIAAFCPLLAQDIKMPVNLDKLAEHATETVDVTLDTSMLQLASRFLSKDDPDEAKVKKLVSKLKGVYVRSFEFDKDGQYSKSDVEAIRSQLRTPDWARIVGVKSVQGENSEVYLKKNGDQLGGLVVICAEPKELTIVHIDGPIDPEELSELGGHMGIPKLDKSKPGKSGGSKSKSSDEDKHEE